MTILDKCKQIIDTESGRVLLYRDEVEEVLAETQKRKQRKGRDARGAFVTGDWHLEVTGAEFGNDGALNRVDIEGMDYKSSWFHQELVKIESQPAVLTAGDTISRAAAKNELCKMLHDCFGADDEELDAVRVTLDNLPTAQETHEERTETHACDSISRQAAIAEFSCCELTPDGGIDANYAIDFLERLPSAQPQDIARDISRIIENEKDMRVIAKNAQTERKTGRWIDAVLPNDNGGLPVQVCDQCNTFFPLAYTGGGHNFCPNCGAKMEVEHG